jgi:hypothetical protein
MTWVIIAELAIIAVSLVLVLIHPQDQDTTTSDWSVDTATDVPTCYEDEPCWDCATMGNHICGPYGLAPVGAP